MATLESVESVERATTGAVVDSQLLTLNSTSTIPRTQVLEEDNVQLSTIKASKFYGSFTEKIDKWEKALNAVSETVDLILMVQKKWMYLESIFMASEDICKQLPQESAIFTEVLWAISRQGDSLSGAEATQ